MAGLDIPETLASLWGNFLQLAKEGVGVAEAQRVIWYIARAVGIPTSGWSIFHVNALYSEAMKFYRASNALMEAYNTYIKTGLDQAISSDTMYEAWYAGPSVPGVEVKEYQVLVRFETLLPEEAWTQAGVPEYKPDFKIVKLSTWPGSTAELDYHVQKKVGEWEDQSPPFKPRNVEPVAITMIYD